MPRLATGKAPASPKPSRKRALKSDRMPTAKPVMAAAMAHHDMITIRTFLGPKRSPSHPAGTWPNA